jgi:hypothetical protein
LSRRPMSDPGNLIPLGEEQAKAAQEAFKTLQGLGGYLKDTFGTVPQDLVGLLGGDWLKVKRAENIVRIVEKARERLEARGVEATEQPSLSVVLPILVAAADESRDELQDIWARLLAAAADPSRAKSFRIAFIDAVKKMDPLDAAVLESAQERGGNLAGTVLNDLATLLDASRDEIDVSVTNLTKLELAQRTHPPDATVSAFGREFLRAVSD